MEKGRPTPQTTASVDMTYSQGLVTLPKQMAVYGGGDAKNAYWQLKEDLCSDCVKNSCQEEAGRRDEYRRPKESVAQAAQDEGRFGWRRGERCPARRKSVSLPCATRSRSVESF